MSPSALRTGMSASRRSLGAALGADGSGHESGWRSGSERAEAERAPGTSASDALEPHWQASIESATD
jgi:hypothetical protein